MCVHICVCEKEREREKVEEKSLMKKGIKLLCSAIYSRARNDYQESRLLKSFKFSLLKSASAYI